MKKKLMLLLGSMLILVIIGSVTIKLLADKADNTESLQGDKLQIVTTFYPVYMIGLNIADQIEGVEVKSLTDLNTGCLHDYQLTTEDMKIISSADIMIINGGGMEGFLEDVVANYPKLTIIDASEGIMMLPSASEDSHEEEVEQDEEAVNDEEAGNNEEAEHAHGEWNAHVWLDPVLYAKQIENISNGLQEYLSSSEFKDEVLSKAIEENAQTYIQKVKELDIEIVEFTNTLNSEGSQLLNEYQAVVFHDAFAYLANRVGVTVAYTIPLDSDTTLAAKDIKDIINEVNEGSIKYLFTEEQYSDSIAKQIEAETDAKVYIIDSAVTGDGSKDSYLTSMKKNIEVLKEALQ
jgi:zinc transport system substrate-binding protein